MKGKKFRYDENKVIGSKSLKRKLALFLAEDDIANRKTAINMSELLAFGMKDRPYISRSEKELIKLFDDCYMSRLEKLEAMKNDLNNVNGNSRMVSWEIKYQKDQIDGMQKMIDAMKPILDELIEEAFSE